MLAPLLMAAALAAAPAAAPTPASTPASTPTSTPTSTPASPPPRKTSTALPPLASDKPVRMDAEEVRFSWRTRQVTVIGRPLVTMHHDDATLSCRKLTGENDAAGKLRQATCEGQVKMTRGDRTVTCERATYDRDAARLVCTGNPVLRDAGGTEARGTTLTYDLGADEVRLEGAAQVTVPAGQMDLLQRTSLRGAPQATPAEPATPGATPPAQPPAPGAPPTQPPPGGARP
ncbi:MAG: organic solvent tolerance protein OstA [Anaeromyxobacter sp.]|nr:organic solvent tolerance protein OstA [Anaeromyxobacter sp.]